MVKLAESGFFVVGNPDIIFTIISTALHILSVVEKLGEELSCVWLVWLLQGKTATDANAVWAAYYAAAQGQQYTTYPAAVQTGATLQSVTGQPTAAQYATLSRAAVTPQPSMSRRH